MRKGKRIKQIVITILETKSNTTIVDLDVKVWPSSDILAMEVVEMLTQGINTVFEYTSKPNKS